MACNGCGGGAQPSTSRTLFNTKRTNLMNKEETIELIFTKTRKGAVQYRGDSGQIYLGADTDEHRTAEVRKIDAPKLLATGHWRLASQPKPTPDLLPDLSEVSATDVPAFVLAYFVSKQPAWQLVIEAFAQQEKDTKDRSSVVNVLESALAFIEKGPQP